MKTTEPKDFLDFLVGVEAAAEIQKEKDKLISPEMIRPFSCGSEFGDWQYRNCEQCKQYDEDVKRTCEYDRELGLAYCTDGLIRKETAEKLGLLHQFSCKIKETP